MQTVQTKQALARTPAQQAVLASVANLPNVAPIGTAPVNQKKAQDKGHQAEGFAIAEKAWRYVQSDALKLRDIASDILFLDNAGRVAFREQLNTYKKAAKEADKVASTAMTRSAFIRVSEFMTVSRAADAGVKPHDIVKASNAKGINGTDKEWKDMTFPYILEYCRTVLNSGATLSDGTVVKAVGATMKKGRKADTSIAKVQKYLLSNFNPKEYPALAKAIAALAAKVHSPEEAKTTLQAMKKA